jgi:(p)ppGpp synthase/HD superfamily hydrolase
MWTHMVLCAALQACYEIQPAVHRLWRPILGELDDYIFSPKASGYQSLHSAVIGEH